MSKAVSVLQDPPESGIESGEGLEVSWEEVEPWHCLLVRLRVDGHPAQQGRLTSK